MKELAKGIQINFLGYLLRIIRAGSFILAAWLFGPENFGVYTLVWASADLVIRLATLGLEQGLLFELSYLHVQKEDERLYLKLASSFKLTLWVSLLCSLGLWGYAYFFVDVMEVRHNLYFLVPIIPINGLAVLLIHASMGLKEMRYKVLVRDGLEPLMVVLFLLLFSQITFLRGYGIVLANCLALFISAVLSLQVFRKFFSLRKLFQAWQKPVQYRSLFKYSLPMYLIEMLDASLFRLDIFLIGAILGAGSPQQQKMIGVYGFTKQVARTLSITKNAFGPIFVSVNSESFLARKISDFQKNIRFSIEKILWINIPFVLGLLCFGRDFLIVFGKDANLMNSSAFTWLVTGQFFYSTFAILIFALVVSSQAKRFLLCHFIILLAAVFSGWKMVHEFQILGAASVLGISYIAVALCAVFELVRNHQFHFLTSQSAKILGAGVAALGVMLTLKKWVAHDLNSIWRIVISLTPGLLIYFLITLFPVRKKRGIV